MLHSKKSNWQGYSIYKCTWTYPDGEMEDQIYVLIS